MRPPLILTAATNPRLKAAALLRNPADRRASGLFLCEGRRAIGRALAAGLEAVELFHAPELTGQATADLLRWLPALAQIPTQCGVYEVPGALLGKLAYLEEPEGLVVVMRQPAWTLDSICDRAGDSPLLLLICAGIEKPGNLGAMVRSVAAAGAHGLVLTGGPIDVCNPNVIRTSTGAIFELPVLSSTEQALADWLTAQQVQLLVATPGATLPYTSADLTQPTALLIGAEATGVPEFWLQHAVRQGAQIQIPMAPGSVVDSLNAAVTAGILLFEAARQRQR